jgi:hypothetical protein
LSAPLQYAPGEAPLLADVRRRASLTVVRNVPDREEARRVLGLLGLLPDQELQAAPEQELQAAPLPKPDLETCAKGHQRFAGQRCAKCAAEVERRRQREAAWPPERRTARREAKRLEARRRYELVALALRATGYSWSQYRALYGLSGATAQAILEAVELDQPLPPPTCGKGDA